MVSRANPGLSNRRVVAEALALFFAWSLGTWIFEGRIRTLLRPEAITDRLIYALGVNLALGVIGGLVMSGRWAWRGTTTRGAPGSVSWSRSLVAMLAGLALGVGIYVLQGAPSTDAAVVLNAFSQVFVVSAAEVIVCWCLVGASVEHALAQRGPVVSLGTAVLFSAALFGGYHFAHSPPFSTLPMVALLSVVGLSTGVFFSVSRDVAATIVYHNFLGMLGVVRALAEADALDTFAQVQPPLVGTAGLTAIVIAGSYWIGRRFTKRLEEVCLPNLARKCTRSDSG